MASTNGHDEGEGNSVEQQLRNRLKEFESQGMINRKTKMTSFKAVSVRMTSLTATLAFYIAKSEDASFAEQLTNFMDRLEAQPQDGKTIFFDYRVADVGDSQDQGSDKNDRQKSVFFEHFYMAVQKLQPEVEGSSSELPLVSYSISTGVSQMKEHHEENVLKEFLSSVSPSLVKEVTEWLDGQMVNYIEQLVRYALKFVNLIFLITGFIGGYFFAKILNKI